MNCFNHEDKTAVGVCKHCHKGICKECSEDLGYGIACKEHISEVENIEKLVSRNIKVNSNLPKNTTFTIYFYLFLGVVFAFFGYNSKGGVYDLPFIMGVGFIIFSIILFIRTKILFSDEKS